MDQIKLAAQLKELFEIQDATNEKAVPKWREQSLPWDHAILVETGEFIDHMGYKWWSKQEPNIKQAQMELIDILHFLLSLTMDNNYPTDLTTDAGTQVIAGTIFEFVTETTPYSGDKQDNYFARSSALSLNKVLYSGDLVNAWYYWSDMCLQVGLGWAEIYAKFIGKAALNRFRWENGYGSTYQKIWNGREDNEYLTELVEATLANNVEPSIELFTSQLSDLYRQIHVQ